MLIVGAIVDKLLVTNESNKKGMNSADGGIIQWDNLHKQIHIFIENILI